jgi:hypothetical protein
MIFLIPARAGSKRLRGKNKKPFCGLPLWEWSLATAVRIASGIDGAVVYVSTDDKEMVNANPWYCKERGRDLSEDSSPTEDLVGNFFYNCPQHLSICLLQPTSPTRPDSLVRKLIAHGGQVRSVTNGKPNGQCYVYRRGHEGWIDIETEQGHDIDTLEQFNAAEQDMMRRFA